MKKTFLFVALAAVAAASCSKAEYLGQQPQKVEKQSPIEIGTSVDAVTKATKEESATLLSNRFIVWGQKTISGVSSSVFDQIPVSYTADGWSYVTASQALRYWDSNAQTYDFIAVSDANSRVMATDVMAKVSAKENVYADGFGISEVTADELAKIYTSSLYTVNNIDFSSPVSFEFSNAAAKVRVGFYNAIPGYDVNVDKFYFKDDTETENTVLKGSFYSKAAYNVSNAGALTVTGTPALTTDIVLGNLIVQSPNANQYIGKSLTAASYDKTAGAYTNVLPVMAAGEDIELKVTYRMFSGNDIISRTCDVTIPAVYAKWQANYAYTYLFKITDNDLHPITFDAIVLDPQKQETVTTVDGDNKVNITIFSEGSNVTVDGGVKQGKDVFASVENVPAATYRVHVGYTDNDAVNGSNAASIITDWSLRTPTTGGRYEIKADKVGYYVIRVTWTDESSVNHYAYMVFKVIA